MRKKIKVIVSDMHLGKGKILPNGAVNKLEEFFFGEKFAELIDYYTTGQFRDYEVELIINGDFLNFLQVDYHGHFLTVFTEEVSLQILKEIVAGQPEAMAALRNFIKDPKHQITYIVGNHDQAMLWPKLRSYLNEVVGGTIRFKSIVHYFDGIHVEHGHMYEAANRINPKKFFLKKDLPVPILNLPFGSHFFVDFVMKIKEKHPHVDKIRPFRLLIRWAILNEFWFTIKSMAALLAYFIKSIFIRDPRRQFPFSRIAKVFLESAIFPDLSDSARKILQDERVHTVVFGHTHVYQYRQWGRDQEYFNTGTWTELTSLDVSSLGKITKLTYVLVEYPDHADRPFCRLKEWKGYHRIEEDVVIA
jgi:UDP-2,3-diacylglucosamine pyrophosphatase LpxH